MFMSGQYDLANYLGWIPEVKAVAYLKGGDGGWIAPPPSACFFKFPLVRLSFLYCGNEMCENNFEIAPHGRVSDTPPS